MNIAPWFLLPPAAALLLVGPVARAATPVTIANPGFEAQVIGENVFPATVTAWAQGQYDVTNPGVWIPGASGAGVYNVSTQEYTSGLAAEGENMSYATTQAGFDTGLNQVLAAKLQADATYTLTVKIGNPAVFNATIGAGPTANWRIELLAGGVLLQSATGPSPVDDTTFTTATLIHHSGATPAQLGQPLEIRLLANDFTSQFQVDFDEVKLTAALGQPVANPGGPYWVAMDGGTLLLNGSASLPSDGAEITHYEWDLDDDGQFNEAISGPAPAAIPVASLETTYGMALGPNPIRLRVTDSAGKSALAVGTVSLIEIPVDLYRSGGGNWDTATANWGTVSGGPYDTATWANASPFIANLEGSSGTLALASDINLFGLNITAGTGWIITDNTLNFAADSGLLFNDPSGSRTATIRSGVKGSPAVTINAGEGLTFDAPAELSQTLGNIAMNCRVGGTGDNRITLTTAADGNSAGDIKVTTSDNGQRATLEKRGSGTWTVGALRGVYNQRLRLFVYDSGKLVVNGDMYGVEVRLESPDAILELRQAGDLLTVPSPAPGGGRPANRFTAFRGTINNASGGLISFVSNPRVDFAGDFTLAGSSLNFGTGAVALGATRQVTVANEASTMTLGGVISGADFGLTKAGPGTLTLTSANTYTGPTTVAGGTLLVNGGQSAATGAVAVADMATLGGSGTLGGSVTVAADANLAPGAPVGTLSIAGDLDLAAQAAGTGRLKFDLDALDVTSDRLAVTGTLAVGDAVLGFSDFTFSNLGGLEAGVYKLITSGGITGTLAGGDLSGAIGTFSGTLRITGNDLELVVTGGAATPYQVWADGAAFDADANGDGVANGLAWLLGAANPAAAATGLLPLPARDEGKLVLGFRCLAEARRGAAVLKVQFSNDLGQTDPWAGHEAVVPAASGTVAGVVFTITPDADPAFIQVRAEIPASAASPEGRLFGRLKGLDSP